MKAILLELLDRLATIEKERRNNIEWPYATYHDEFRALTERLLVLDEARMDQISGRVGEVAPKLASEPPVEVRVTFSSR